jgi:hypothetical protein
MSQRECAGFNAPRFSVEAGEKVVSSPEVWFGSELFTAQPASLVALVNVSGVPRCAPVDSESSAFGVGQLANFATCSRLTVCLRPSSVLPVALIFPGAELRPPLGVFGVGQLASVAASCSVTEGPPALRLSGSCGPPRSFVSGVGHPVKPLSSVRRADARSAQIGSPDGISCSFQVSANSGEPFTSICSRNLFSKDRCRPALGDERVKSGPQVSFVGMAFSLSSARKRLTRTGAGPDRPFVWPAGEPERGAPSANPGEKMALCVSFEFIGFDFQDAPFVNDTRRNQSSANQLAHPGRAERVVVVVVDHSLNPPRSESPRGFSI